MIRPIARLTRRNPGLYRPVLAALAFAIGLASVMAAVLVTDVRADFALAHWRFYKTVTLPPSVAQGQLVELPLDREVFLESNLRETDLRLVSGQVREVPYQLVVLEEADTRTPVQATIRDQGHVAGEYSTLVADLGGNGNLHSEVVIDTREHNFRRTVVVETSGDAVTWAVAREDGEIYGFTSSDQEFRVHHTSVRYPQSAARYLRVKVLNGGEAPLQIIGAKVYLAEEVAARETEYAPMSVAVSRDEHGTTYHLLDLGASGVPVSRLSFRSDNQNYYRGAGVEGSNDENAWESSEKGAWEWLGGAHIYSFNTPRFQGDLLEIDLKESRYRYYRLAVDDADNAPLSLADYTFHSADRLLRFQAEPGGQYALYYGNPVAEAPVYDLPQVVPYLETEDLPVAALGPQQDNEAFTGLDVPVTERLPWLMPSAVGLAALVVAFFLYRVIRQARNVLPPAEEESTT